MDHKEYSIQSTLMVILSVLLFVCLLINYGISLNPDHYKDPNVNKYEKWVSLENVD